MKSNKRFENLINSEKPVLVDFYTEWCNPCKQIPQIIKEVKNVTKSNIRIIKVDVDKFPSIATTFNVQNVPTLMIFKNGQPLWTKIGVPCTSELMGALSVQS